MRPSFWIAGVPLLFCGAFFAIANRDPVAVDLWPVSGRIETPLFVALIAALYTGVALGVLVAWWAGRHGRRAARDARRKATELETEIQRMRKRLDDSETRAGTMAAGLSVTVRP